MNMTQLSIFLFAFIVVITLYNDNAVARFIERSEYGNTQNIVGLRTAVTSGFLRKRDHSDLSKEGIEHAIEGISNWMKKAGNKVGEIVSLVSENSYEYGEAAGYTTTPGYQGFD